jgi:hypothetical protein
MTFEIRSRKWSWALGTLFVVTALGAAAARAGGVPPSPPGIQCPCGDDDRGGGGGGQPDPHGQTIFNQHVELADGELYLLKGHIMTAPALMGSSHKIQAYLAVDLSAHAWLAGKKRTETPVYPIEGSVAAWRSHDGANVELAAKAHVQVLFTRDGTPVQVITLVPIPELTTFPDQR